ncbi:hypothetical protein LguiB_004324 [Lonicera macranthoides]
MVLVEVDVVSILNTKIRGLMSRTEELVQLDAKGLNNFAKQLDKDGFVNLKKLNISDSDDIIDVFHANLPTGSLGRLKEVLLPSMSELLLRDINMVSIVGAQMRPGSLYKLRYLRLYDCRKIVCVVAFEAIKQLKNLEILLSWNCDSAETLFDLEGLEGEVMVRGQLVSINLYLLVELRHLWKNVPRRGFQGFQNLTKLYVNDCNKLSYLLSP